jgi:hypothetical protein
MLPVGSGSWDAGAGAITTIARAFTVSGALIASSTLNVVGNFSVATSKFTVAAASGNTVVAGTLGVTGVATFTAQPIVSSLTASQAVFTDSSKGLVSNAITGSGNVVMSASPTLTGTITAASLTASGDMAVAGKLLFDTLSGNTYWQLNGAGVMRAVAAGGAAFNVTGSGPTVLNGLTLRLQNNAADANATIANTGGAGSTATTITSSAVTFTGNILSQGLASAFGSNGGNLVLQFGKDTPSADNEARFRFQPSSSAINWVMGVNTSTGGGGSLAFIPSTAGGGTTFSTATLILLSGTGTVTHTGAAISGVTTLATTDKISIAANGLDLTGNPASAAASHVNIGGAVQTTIGANGAASALTANPLGYLKINVAGTSAIIPYYNA